jgi:hypothetical protein
MTMPLHVIEVLPGRQKRVYALRQLASLGLEMPDLQRPADALRVKEIIEYHTNRGVSPIVFVGDLVISRNGDRMYVVDGQHRLLAMLQLASVHPDAPVSLEVIDVATMPMRELFVMINRATPVPDYVIDGMLGAERRRVLDAFGARFRAAFPKFISPARNPRRPNVSLDRLLDRVAASDVLLSRFNTGEHLFRYVAWASARLESSNTANTIHARAKANPPLFLTSDIEDAWASDVTLVDAFLKLDPPWSGHPLPPAPTSTPATRRSSLPTSLRNAVWNAAFGPRVGEGPCHCCGRTVTHQDFECGHVVAAARGGGDVVGNLKVLCRSCNRGMGTQDMRDFSTSFAPSTVV